MIRKDFDHWTKTCKQCAAGLTARRKLIAQLQAVTVGVQIAKVATDILGPLLGNRNTGNKYILFITDYFSKHATIVSLSLNLNGDGSGNSIR